MASRKNLYADEIVTLLNDNAGSWTKEFTASRQRLLLAERQDLDLEVWVKGARESKDVKRRGGGFTERRIFVEVHVLGSADPNTDEPDCLDAVADEISELAEDSGNVILAGSLQSIEEDEGLDEEPLELRGQLEYIITLEYLEAT